MGAPDQQISLTSALEDYLESIYELVRDKNFARIKDIAQARGVRSGSVSPAMRRLAEMGLVTYRHREYISLTERGEREARKIYAKHQILTQFFHQILRMPAAAARKNACAMEHSLTQEGMDHLVRLFEFLRACPEGHQLLDRFHTCSLVHEDVAACPRSHTCKTMLDRADLPESITLAQVSPGSRVRVTQVGGAPELREVLLDKGLIPDTRVSVLRLDPSQGEIWIQIQGFKLTVSEEEAQAIQVVAAESNQ